MPTPLYNLAWVYYKLQNRLHWQGGGCFSTTKDECLFAQPAFSWRHIAFILAHSKSFQLITLFFRISRKAFDFNCESAVQMNWRWFCVTFAGLLPSAVLVLRAGSILMGQYIDFNIFNCRNECPVASTFKGNERILSRRSCK